MKNCVFAGTFDPVTVGHEKIIRRCALMFDKVFVIVGENPNKTPAFTMETRLKALRAVFGGEDNIVVSSYVEHGDYGKFLKDNGVVAYVRGIRSTEDFVFERSAEEKNALTYPDINTVYICADKGNDVSSTQVKNIIRGGGDYSALVPEKAKGVIERAAEKLQ